MNYRNNNVLYFYCIYLYYCLIRILVNCLINIILLHEYFDLFMILNFLTLTCQKLLFLYIAIKTQVCITR